LEDSIVAVPVQMRILKNTLVEICWLGLVVNIYIATCVKSKQKKKIENLIGNIPFPLMERLVIYTDGSCKPNPGAGGWGYIAIFPDCEIWGNGGAKRTTNNVMELTAVIEALREFDFAKRLHIYTDSLYVVNCAQGKWERKKNREYWKKYDVYATGKDIVFEWVKGHNGDYYNELVDKLAQEGVAH